MASALGSIIKTNAFILFFEMIGSAFITCMFMGVDPFYLTFLAWALYAMGSKISGGHYNPATTLGYMLRVNAGTFSRLLGFAYIIFQGIGAFGAALAMDIIFPDESLRRPKVDDNYGGLIIFSIYGTFVYVFFHLL
jgi:glycerol uptake facilitator-like aquaporin